MEIKSKSIQIVDIDSLVPNPKNNNKHPKEQIERLAKLIKYQGFRNPLVVSNRSGFVLCGHGRIEAAKLAGLKEVPVMYQDFENEAQEYAYLTSDNAIASWAELDLSAVNSEMLDLGPEFDVDLLGIKDFVIEPIEKFEPQADEDAVPEVVHPITRKGDIWLLGNHRLMCGDSTMIDDVEKLMNGEKAELLLTDPPYNQNVGLTGDIENAGMKKRQEDLKNSNLNDFNPEEFLKIVTLLEIDSLYIFHSKNLISKYINYFDSIKRNWELLAMTKPSVMPFRKGHFLNDIEWMIFSKKAGAYFNEKLENSYYSKFRSAKTVREKENWHPTRKDVDYLCAYIEISAKSMVLDLFLGSGSTLIACEKTNRKCYGMELDEKYCDVIINRWQNYTGKKATLESTGQTYEELKLERGE